MHGPPRLYHYTARFLSERGSWFVDGVGGRVDLVFESRETLSYGRPRECIGRLKSNPSVPIRPVIGNVQAATKDQWKMLQVADACAGAAFVAMEKNRYGLTEATYVNALAAQVYRYGAGRKLIGYGLKVFPDQVTALAEHGCLNRLWQKEKQARAEPLHVHMYAAPSDGDVPSASRRPAYPWSHDLKPHPQQDSASAYSPCSTTSR